MIRGVRSTLRRFAAALALLGALALSGGQAVAKEALPRQLEGVTLTEHLGARVDLDLRFTDHDGASVRLGDYLDDGVPVLLTLNYYRCKTLCSVQLNALLTALDGLDWSAGQDPFRIVTISIDPSEKPDVAAGKRAAYLGELGRGEVDWSFLVGDADQVRALADTIGYGYRYDDATDQWAHPAALTFLAPDGTVARYLYGIQYAPRDVKFALMEAAAGRLGSPVDRLVLSCFGYDETAGRYTASAYGVMRLGGVFTMLSLGVFSLVMWRRERLTRRSGSPS